MPEVTDDVWIDFADAAYMKRVLALPDLAGSRVKVRVTPTGLERPTPCIAQEQKNGAATPVGCRSAGEPMPPCESAVGWFQGCPRASNPAFHYGQPICFCLSAWGGLLFAPGSRVTSNPCSLRSCGTGSSCRFVR